MNFQYILYFPNYEKLNSFVETFTPYHQILIFEEQLCMSNMDFYFETDQAQINKCGAESGLQKSNNCPRPCGPACPLQLPSQYRSWAHPSRPYRI
jgi:hypothetical protein